MRATIAALLIVSCGLALWVYFSYAHDLAAAHLRLEGKSETIQTRFGRMEYTAAGAGTPVLIVHGASGGFDQGLQMAGAVSGRGFRVVAVSRFGYLRSDMPKNATVAMQADAYADLLDRLGIAKADLIGISAGAWSVLEFAIRHPERCHRIVLLVPADFLPPGVTVRGGALVRAIFSNDFAAWAALKLVPVVPAMTRMILGTDDSVIRHASAKEQTRVSDILHGLLPVSARKLGTGLDIAAAGHRHGEALAKIACPLLAISAEDDAFATARRARYIAASIPHGRTLIFKSGGHALVGDHDAALAAGTAFFREK